MSDGPQKILVTLRRIGLYENRFRENVRIGLGCVAATAEAARGPGNEGRDFTGVCGARDLLVQDRPV